MRFRYFKSWFKHIRSNPRDFFLLFKWFLSNILGRTSLQDETPWLTYRATDWLRQNIKDDMKTFEYGSGGSTLFFSKNVQNHNSVEHDRTWYQIMNNLINQKKLINVKLSLKIPSHIQDNDYESTDKNYKGLSFREYSSFIDSFPDGSFDIILVDGRSRNSCIRHAIRKVRAGGYIILDNSERPEYDQTELIKNFEQTIFFGPGPYERSFWQTTVYKKSL